jgi:dihydrofolate reductase
VAPAAEGPRVARAGHGAQGRQWDRAERRGDAMGELVVSEWVTLDGVFDADTMKEWFEPYHSDGRAEYIRDVILASGALLIGRTTYEMFAAYWPTQKNNEMGTADKLNSMPKHVVSLTLKKAEWNNSEIIKDDVVKEIARLKQRTRQHILMPGSTTLVQSLMGADLIDEYQILVHPIIMGSGKRFFKDGMATTKLKLVSTRTLDLGVSLFSYRPAQD